jgi:ABC-type uncharacterized transport system ATPase subunit
LLEGKSIMGNELLKMEDITKVYTNGVLANNRVQFSLEKGEIHGLIGENGAGKSTLMKILYGLEQPDSGEIFLDGKKVTITSPHVAIKYGIGMVHQHFKLVPSLTVAENLVLGAEPKKGIFFNKEKANQITEDLSQKYALKVHATSLVENISVVEKQKLEILKALYSGAKILILDEPTAVLTPQETKELFSQLLNLKMNGHTIVFISHKLKELKEICDKLTVMRNGKIMGVFEARQVSEHDISRIMVGRDVVLKVDKEVSTPKAPILKVEAVDYGNEFKRKIIHNVSFSVRRGEILGIAGVEGNGQKELIEIITGFKRATKGNVIINENNISELSVKEIRNLRLSYIPEDRMAIGVAKDVSIQENLISNEYSNKELHGKLFMKMDRIKQLADDLINDFKVKCKSSDVHIGMLSGGNIQKVVVAREVHSNPELLVAEQPTRGVDIGAIEFIHKKIVEIRDAGCAILLVSADLNEVLELSDSLLVIYAGEIVAYFDDVSNLPEEELGLYMLGIKKQSPEEIGRAIYV